MQTVSARLADFIHSLDYGQIPKDVLEKAKLLILDTVGVCIGSTQLDFSRQSSDLAQRWGGREESSIIGEQRLVPAQYAAMANGVLAHGQDFDDTHAKALIHPSGVLVPALLASAERAGSSGKEALVALVAASEATIRLALPARHRLSFRGFQTTMVIGCFGAAMVAARIAGFDKDRITQALGIAGSFTSGLLECVPAGASTKQLHPGWAAMSGIMATEFAASGFTGPQSVFEGKLGLYNAFLHGEEVNFDAVFEGLRSDWEILQIRPKLYPCGHPLNTFIDCASLLRRNEKIKAERITSILCEVAQGSVSMVCEPWKQKQSPLTGYDGRFSMPFAVAVMLVKGHAGIDQFTDDEVQNPLVRLLMTKTRYRVEPSFQHHEMPARITVELDDGTTWTQEMSHGRGDTRAPISDRELLDKFHANTVAIPASKAAAISQSILHLEESKSLANLMTMLRK